MKKKLLSLVLAGAMVASTSVSAFADEITVDTNGKNHKVEMRGIVEDEDGNIPSGTITVTVPTAVSFTIDEDGNVNAGTIGIVNRNSEREKVKVVVKEFNDSNSTEGIVLVKEDQLGTEENGENKVHASLKLHGETTSVQLVSSKTTSPTGLLDENGSPIQSSVDTSLGEAWDDNDLTLRLTGRTKDNYEAPEAGKSIKNNFSLLLKIQKVN